MHAPINGRVLRIPRQSVGVVAPGQALVEVGDPAALEVEIEVLSADAVRIIADITTPADTWSRLGDGYRVEADFILWQGEDVLQIPASALFRHGDGWAVFRYDGTRARLQPVDIDHNNGFAAELVSGLNAGDAVIVHPSDAIADGVRVEAR